MPKHLGNKAMLIFMMYILYIVITRYDMHESLHLI